MKTRINKRTTNLAKVSLSTIEDDMHFFSGITAIGSYFDTNDRKEIKVSKKSSDWVFEKTGENIPSGRYMYAVGANGGLYVRHVTFHSQFKAGRASQSAGYVTYISKGEGNTPEVLFDNDSGHYHPTLSQFLSTMYGLVIADLLPPKFGIQLNSYTTLDYSFDISFFSKASRKGEQQSRPLSDVILIEYDRVNDSFLFTDKDKNQLELSSAQLLENGGFDNLPKQESVTYGNK